MRERLSPEGRPRQVRVRARSRRLATKRLKPRRSCGLPASPRVREPRLITGLEIRVTGGRQQICFELFGDLSRPAAGQLFSCLEDALETSAERLILDLRGLYRLDAEAVSPILIAQLVADSEHRQLLLIAGSDSVQQVVDRIQGPFSYVDPNDDSLLRADLGRSVVSTGGRSVRPRRQIIDLLLGPTDRLIAATEHAPEPISTLEYAGASALLGALELWLLVANRLDRFRR